MHRHAMPRASGRAAPTRRAGARPRGRRPRGTSRGARHRARAENRRARSLHRRSPPPSPPTSGPSRAPDRAARASVAYRRRRGARATSPCSAATSLESSPLHPAARARLLRGRDSTRSRSPAGRSPCDRDVRRRRAGAWPPLRSRRRRAASRCRCRCDVCSDLRLEQQRDRGRCASPCALVRRPLATRSRDVPSSTNVESMWPVAAYWPSRPSAQHVSDLEPRELQLAEPDDAVFQIHRKFVEPGLEAMRVGERERALECLAVAHFNEGTVTTTLATCIADLQ